MYQTKSIEGPPNGTGHCIAEGPTKGVGTGENDICFISGIKQTVELVFPVRAS